MDAKTYNTLKKIFPLAFKFSDSVGTLILGIFIHLVGGPIVAMVVGGILGLTFILAPLSGVVGIVIGVYAWVAVIFEILVFAKVIKEPEAAEKTTDEKAEDNTTDVE